jgi:hypothetical protein
MIEDLATIGISESQAKAYLNMIKKPYVVPSDFCVDIDESRTNTYKILDDLVDKKMATKTKKGNKIIYIAESPVILAELAREKKDFQVISEQKINKSIPNLLKSFNATHEKPGVNFYTGKSGIESIYKLQIQENRPIQFFKTRQDIKFFGFEFMHKIRNLAPKAGIKRKAFTPDAPETPIDIKKSDKEMLLERTWYLQKDYTAPVEWSVFGNKTSIISFGKEAIGIVIDSEQIAESIRQLFRLLDEGLKRRPGYQELPKRGEFTSAEDFIEKHNNTLPV